MVEIAAGHRAMPQNGSQEWEEFGGSMDAKREGVLREVVRKSSGNDYLGRSLEGVCEVVAAYAVRSCPVQWPLPRS
jgi:hypothetical protein